MDVPGVVQWWDEWQLRILVLGSLVIQYILLGASCLRKFPIRSWFRPVIWLAYLGSDAIAIYALAALFNRQKQDVHGVLEVLWAPILLIHLGGQDGITAYNIEDNELWRRHIFTAVSQVTVALYVFCKSWPDTGDTNLLVAAILLFIPGILKCFEKPWALSRASINSLVSSCEPVRRSIDTHKLKIDPLEDFIDKAISPAGPNDHLLTLTDNTRHKLFVDLASPSVDDRIRMLRSFSALDDHLAYHKLQSWISETFQFLYTKEKVFSGFIVTRARPMSNLYTVMKSSPALFFGVLVRGVAMYLPFAAIVLFQLSHREDYSEDDVKVTYALLVCTAVLEYWESALNMNVRTQESSWLSKLVKSIYDDKVYQYNLIELLVRNKEHSSLMSIVGFLRCDDFLHQHWRMKSCSSSFSITKLVLQYVKDGWKHHIKDVSSYRKFNDNRGQFTLLQHQGCYQELGWSLEGAFDESVLLWHLATDFCYYDKGASRSHHGYQCTQDSCPHAWCKKSDHHKRAVQCREMSNYMMYLLFVNPEMLMAGTRRNLFTAAYDELKNINPQGDKLEQGELTRNIIAAVDAGEGPPGQGGMIRDARIISKVLLGLLEDKVWDVIEGVWVEMMCFSAARCRGYLHAKGLATGVEYLTYVWLLLYYMGMETLAAKLQRADHHYHNGGVHGEDPSTSRGSRAATTQEEAAVPSRSSGTYKEHAECQSAGYQGSDPTWEEIV